MTLPHAFKRVTLHLARSKEFPSGADEQIGRLIHEIGAIRPASTAPFPAGLG
jgi:hypothetical protein